MTDDTAHLHAANAEAGRQWALKIHRRGRKPEGVFDGDTGKFTPSEAEAPRHSVDGKWIYDRTPRAVSVFHSWKHVAHLCRRARAGDPAPVDIMESFQAEFGKISERHLKGAVDEQLKAESVAHEKAQRKALKLAKLAAAQSREGRLAERRARLARIDALIKKREAQIKALRTRRSHVTRSIAMLERGKGKP